MSTYLLILRRNQGEPLSLPQEEMFTHSLQFKGEGREAAEKAIPADALRFGDREPWRLGIMPTHVLGKNRPRPPPRGLAFPHFRH